MSDDMQDREFVEYVLKTIVDNPDEVKVDRTIDEMGVLLSVSVNQDDMGKVIGKSGQTAKAIRTLLKVVGAKHDARVNMKIIEPDGGGSSQPQPGTTDAADDPGSGPGAGSEPSEAEAVAEQRQTDAAAPQPSENDEIVDEASGAPQPQEPVAQDEIPPEQSPAASVDERDRTLHEKSPLDEL